MRDQPTIGGIAPGNKIQRGGSALGNRQILSGVLGSGFGLPHGALLVKCRHDAAVWDRGGPSRWGFLRGRRAAVVLGPACAFGKGSTHA